MVSSADEARHIVDCAKYLPKGHRGVALQVAHDDYRPGPVLNKLCAANQRTALMALIETVPGLESVEEIAAVPGINVLHRWILNKFYFDALYDVFVVGLTKLIAFIARTVDTWIVDGAVNGTAVLTRWLAGCTGIFDNRVVDGVANGAAALTHSGGQILRQTHGGRIRHYVLVVFASAVIVLLIVVTAAHSL